MRRTFNSIPMIGFAAWSGTGKTTLLRALLPRLRRHGLRVGVVKHAHHDFDIDIPGKDSYELRRAGATHVLVGSRRRWALIVETDLQEDPSLAEMLAHLGGQALDLILIEGLKREAIPKIELHRPALGMPTLFPDDPHIVAVAADRPIATPPSVALLDLNDPDEVAAFILRYLGLADNVGRETVDMGIP
ncbi:MAG: molybdopterin-guanine dinucleotide biosynthesis protein B [Gammaproteobacteria bacterium]|nr:molybdopterin-guanine dinucleotide biosynthesis protein B [Gammaproteobacteria bacterium]